jgi:DinB superfamily
MSDVEQLDEAQVLAHRDAALGQMKFNRQYLKGLIEGVPRELWTVIPEGAKSHLLWQVGHVAVAEYGLLLFRQRGRAEGDIQLMPGWLRKNFGRGSQASVVADYNPTPDGMLRLLDAIDEQCHCEAANYAAESLLEPADMPYAVYPMKLGAMLFAPLHEAIHIGQIGVLRRLLGLEPVR